MPTDPISRVRRICMALPEAHEQKAWGEPTFRVRNKIFAMFASGSTHHGGGRDSLWCKAPIGLQEMLIRQDADTYFSPPYVGVKGWIGVVIGRVDDAALESHVVESYCLVAPKKLAALAGG